MNYKMNYKKVAWYRCEHTWEVVYDSDLNNGGTEVRRTKCDCPGEQNNKTKEVFWPAT